MNRAKAVINTDNLKHNLRIIKEKSESEIIGIVKSNAYGLGAVKISKILIFFIFSFCHIYFSLKLTVKL